MKNKYGSAVGQDVRLRCLQIPFGVGGGTLGAAGDALKLQRMMRYKETKRTYKDFFFCGESSRDTTAITERTTQTTYKD
jgi:hypothetical protein